MQHIFDNKPFGTAEDTKGMNLDFDHGDGNRC